MDPPSDNHPAISSSVDKHLTVFYTALGITPRAPGSSNHVSKWHSQPPESTWFSVMSLIDIAPVAIVNGLVSYEYWVLA